MRSAVIFFLLLLFSALFSCKKTKGVQNDVPQINYEGMVLIPAGETTIGNNNGFLGEHPEFNMHFKAFYLDEHEVTVEQFKQFIDATGYITDAEKFGDAGVFDLKGKQWYLQKGATWKYPQGPNKPAALSNHPVTQVSHNDALAYCAWIGKRLPTEFEFEYAAKNANKSHSTFTWGNALVTNNKYMANTWQGSFPDTNTVRDGYLFTAPIGSFGKNSFGISDLGGNVWEWTSSWYESYEKVKAGIIDSSSSQYTIKGGSFLCDTLFCCGYRVSARTGTSPETSLFHLGFRCAADAPVK